MILNIPLAQLTFLPSPDQSSDESVLTVQLAVSDSAGTLTRGPAETIEISVPHSKLEVAREDFWTHRTQVVLPDGRAGIGALVIEKGTGVWATASFTIAADD